MKNFLIVERQANGCDYTIGCGVRVDMMRAESMDDCLERLRADKDQVSEWTSGESERESVEIYEIGASVLVPLDVWREEVAAARRAARATKKEQDERDTLAALQKKYGAST
jgi:hypothetical protein